MIQSLSHITFVVKNLDKTTALFKELLNAEEVYYSDEKRHSIYKESFFIIGSQWIVVMEDSNIINRTYHHIAFKTSEADIDSYLNRIRALGLELKPPRERVPGEGYSIYFYDYDNNLFELHTETLEKRLALYGEMDRR